MQETKMIYNHHTDTIEEVQPYVQWNVYLYNNYGEKEMLSVWAPSQIEAENNALFECNIRNASVLDSVLTDDARRTYINLHT